MLEQFGRLSRYCLQSCSRRHPPPDGDDWTITNSTANAAAEPPGSDVFAPNFGRLIAVLAHRCKLKHYCLQSSVRWRPPPDGDCRTTTNCCATHWEQSLMGQAHSKIRRLCLHPAPPTTPGATNVKQMTLPLPTKAGKPRLTTTTTTTAKTVIQG